ncbi:MAG: ABC transporter ATP-binding protein, partial [Thermoplasmata archaeon]|nr:ABC transporter ATP-binding protein [Thermoplasmata archaeon]
MVTMNAVMEAVGLRKRYGRKGVEALRGVSFSIERGESVGYLGPNGAGKSTTIKIFTTLIRPGGGRALLNGYDVSSDPKRALSRVGALVEVPGLYDYLTPREMLSYVGRVYGMDRRDIEERMEEVMGSLGLGDWMDRRLRTFSTGMRRRFSIGQAVIHDPDVVILDEPVLGLDPAGIREIRVFLQDLKREDKTVFLSSHLLGEVEEVCDRVLLINRGQIIGEKRLEDLRRDMGGGYILLYQDTPPPGEIEVVASLPGVSNVVVEGSQVRVVSDGGLDRRVLTEAAVVKGSALGIWPIAPTLEDIYVQAMELDGGGKVGG